MTKSSYLALGLMSGTSLDGVDAALLTTDGVDISHIGPARTTDYPAQLRERLRSILGARAAADEISAVERDITLFHAQAVRELLNQAGLRPEDVNVIGFHGHTILHRPAEGRTWQIGDGALLAAETGIAVVNDFRTSDVAAGGQGAPLVPIFHAAMSRGLERPLVLFNIGGVGNVTWIGESEELLAFDTGPGNALLDDWALRHTGRPVDLDGLLARSGTIDAKAVAAFARHPYFAKPPPKSLDRDDFRHFATSLVEPLSPPDGAATLVAFTARAAAEAQRHFPHKSSRWLVCGGGRRNPVLMGHLRRALASNVDGVEVVGWDGDALEAQAFAYLAARSLKGLPLTLPGTTGVAKPTTGGKLHLPPEPS